MSKRYNWLQRVWYEDAGFGWLLWPLTGLYGLVSAMRRMAYQRGWLRSVRVGVPVVVVGNITAGGTGKTPTVIWLVEQLRRRGFSPGIVSRGYGGSHSGTSMRVDADSDPAVVGDEPVLLARRAACPIAVDSDRVRAVEMLIDDGVDAVVADDGLQHYRLQRDFEICIIDGARGLGNGSLLPRGPLRESPERLRQVDAVLVNGPGFEAEGSIRFDLQSTDAKRVNGSSEAPLASFAKQTVHGVAAIGNPTRFFDMLRNYGLQVIEHAMPDHAGLSRRALEFGDTFDVLMTEKDVVKLKATMPNRFWYVPVELILDDVVGTELMTRIADSIGEYGETV